MSLQPLPILRNPKPHLVAYVTMIREAMQRQKLDYPGLCNAMGTTQKERPGVYNWITGKNGPGPDARVKLARVLGLTEDQLIAPLKDLKFPGRQAHHRSPPWETPEDKARRLHKKVSNLGPAQRAVALAATQAGPTAATSVLVAAPEQPVRDVFTIAGRSDGQISVQLRVTLDATRGMALARFLMDFGLIVGDQEA